jgi:cation transport ATPase
VNTFLFDKTGTLTVGNPQVTDFVLVNSDGEGNFIIGFLYICLNLHLIHLVIEIKSSSTSAEKKLLTCLGSAESASEHPIGKAILAYCKVCFLFLKN